MELDEEIGAPGCDIALEPEVCNLGDDAPEFRAYIARPVRMCFLCISCFISVLFLAHKVLMPAAPDHTVARPQLPSPSNSTPNAGEELTFKEFFSQLQQRNNVSSQIDRAALELNMLRYVELEHPILAVRPDCPNVAQQSTWDMGVITAGRYIKENVRAIHNVNASDLFCDRAFFSGPMVRQENIVFDVVLFSYELDVLELRLHTLNSSIDKFVIVEFDVSHQGEMKSLAFGRNKKKSRFAAFSSKIVHLPISKTSPFVRDSRRGKETGIFKIERTHTRAAIAAFRHYVKQSEEYGPIANSADSGRLLYHFSHADEIPHPSNIRKVKHCQVKDSVLPLRNALWFAMSDLRFAFRSDFPAPGLPYTLATMSTINAVVQPAGGSSNFFVPKHNFLVGGWHMSGVLYAPFEALKLLTATEASRFNFLTAPFSRLCHVSAGRVRRMVPVTRLKAIKNVTPMLYIPPAYAMCNRDRYEVWFTRKDRRDALKIFIR